MRLDDRYCTLSSVSTHVKVLIIAAILRPTSVKSVSYTHLTLPTKRIV